MPREAENLVGRKFGTRKVMRRAASREYNGYKVIYWTVKCLECSTVSDVQGSSLKRGAGCQHCRGAGRPNGPTGAPQRAAATKDRASSPQQRKQLTVRDVMRVLADLSESALVYVHLVGKDGHATRKVKDVSAVRGHVLLVAELPGKIEPWRG